MENGLCIWRIRSKSILFLILALALSSCGTHGHQKPQRIPVAEESANAVLVCRLGTGFFSGYFRQYASKEQRFSHIGILSFEQGALYVYHSEASELTGVGSVKCDLLTNFLEGIQHYDYYAFDYADSVKAQILDTVKRYYAQHTPFDLDFNSADDKSLYCTELIAASVNKVVCDTLKIQPTLDINGKKVFALDDIYLDKHVRLLKVKP